MVKEMLNKLNNWQSLPDTSHIKPSLDYLIFGLEPNRHRFAKIDVALEFLQELGRLDEVDVSYLYDRKGRLSY